MMHPAGAQNPVGAMEVMDFYYNPEVATTVTEWVLYISPVPATKVSSSRTPMRPRKTASGTEMLYQTEEVPVPER